MTYHGRSGPNITEYVRNIDNLNEIPDQDIPNASLEYDMEADLAMFTNTNFYDFELGAGEALPVDGFAEHIDGEAAAPNVDIKSLEFTQGMPNRCRFFFTLLGLLFLHLRYLWLIGPSPAWSSSSSSSSLAGPPTPLQS